MDAPGPAAADTAPPPAAGRRLGPEQRRAHLVSVGLTLLKSGPLDAITAPAVAGAAGVSKGLVFHYFPTQRELQAAIAGAAADEMLARFSAIDPQLDYVSQLRAGLEAFISYIEQQPASYAAIARDAGSDEQLRAVFERTREAIVDLVCRVLGMPEPTPLLRLYLRGWIALAEETVLQWALTQAVTRDELVTHLQSSAFEILARAVGSRLD